MLLCSVIVLWWMVPYYHIVLCFFMSLYVRRKFSRVAMLLPCYCHVIAMPILFTIILPCCCHAMVMLLPCYCHVIAMLSPCYFHVVSMLFAGDGHIIAEPLPLYSCHALAVLLSCR